jgi:nucleoside phosphorylase
MGLAPAASLAAQAIQVFRPNHVVMLGITAGNRKKTRLGDIVIPRQVWDYGAGKWTQEANKLSFQARPERRELPEEVRQWCERLASRKTALQKIRDNWAGRPGVRIPAASLSKPLKVHIGPMVSGAAVVNAEAIWERVLDHDDTVLALDMEAFGVALATSSSGFGAYRPYWLVVKSVCDYGIRKTNGAQPYAAYSSVRFFKMYLEDFVMEHDYQRRPIRSNVI